MLLIGLLVWGLPVAAVALLTGVGSVFTQQGLFFSGAAVVTFGGAYAVLAYVAQQAVSVYGWLAPGEMVRGLALAETTPGPLIMVVQFVAFLGAYRDPGALDPWVAAVLASLLVTWVTFVPSFLFVLLGAPYMERLRGNRSLSAALDRHHRGGRRGHRQPGRLLRRPHAVRRDPPGRLVAARPGAARPEHAAAGGARHRADRRGPDLPAHVVGPAHPRRLRAARPRGRTLWSLCALRPRPSLPRPHRSRRSGARRSTFTRPRRPLWSAPLTGDSSCFVVPCRSSRPPRPSRFVPGTALAAPGDAPVFSSTRSRTSPRTSR